MKSPTAFRVETDWTHAEKKIARKAFHAALYRQCEAVTERAKKMLASSSPPYGVWKLHDYLTLERDKGDRRHDYRYSVLISVFAQLLRDKWLKLADLEGLSEDKIEQIKYWVER